MKLVIKKDGDISGTSLIGYINIEYTKLAKLLGKPEKHGSHKVDAIWVTTINDKTITVYNYCDGKNYLGSRGMPVSKITNWHIGGRENSIPEAKFLAKELGVELIEG